MDLHVSYKQYNQYPAFSISGVASPGNTFYFILTFIQSEVGFSLFHLHYLLFFLQNETFATFGRYYETFRKPYIIII